MSLEPETVMTVSPTQPDRRRTIAPLAAGLLIVALIVGVALVVRVAGSSDSDSGSGGEPPVLRLTTLSGPVAADAGRSDPARSHYVLNGALPSGRPGPAPVYRFGADRAPAELVRRLGKALKVQGSPVRTPTGWQLGTADRLIGVHDGGDWAWSLGPDQVVADSPVQCFRAPCPYETPDTKRPRSQPAPASPEVTARIAKDVLTALDLPADDLTITGAGQQTLVRAPRSVDGKHIEGFGTTLSIGAGDKVDSGNGWLGQPTRPGPSYPLISAADAFKRLQAQPYPEILLCRPQTGGGCAPSPQVSVTGAKLGLLLAQDSTRPLLVPSWLFRVAGQADPIAVVAVESRYLRTPTLPKPGNSPGDGEGVGGGNEPQSVLPVAPVAPSDGPHPASPKPR